MLGRLDAWRLGGTVRQQLGRSAALQLGKPEKRVKTQPKS